MQLLGGNLAANAVGLDTLPGVSNYLSGNDPSKWHTDIASFARVQEQGVYPGVDLVFYGNQRQLEYDFTVAPVPTPESFAWRSTAPTRPRSTVKATWCYTRRVEMWSSKGRCSIKTRAAFGSPFRATTC